MLAGPAADAGLLVAPRPAGWRPQPNAPAAGRPPRLPKGPLAAAT